MENSTLGQEFEFFLEVQMIGLDSFNINISLARIKKILLKHLVQSKNDNANGSPNKTVNDFNYLFGSTVLVLSD